ncbi:YifB family Mg chelatase-like AAA ATPase [Clostridium sp. MCC353]|uniref:YifB family Mg chelatase-like AAA ATPase n=1 Tax=Clostridium sp. MCC353 TaxID=2592646 RepID=UPI001C033BE2|nr:YifB family Mg chelatase-like AAA ATPase [Clostridium sp. MCC353]MBT9778297.1 YifB family Mg chelatase-like AAA ATPase [Clostridium sp. MCC353]
MFSKAFSGGISGLDGYIVSIEADVSDGLPGFSMVGYLAAEVKEAQDRVRTALRNSGFRLQAKKITVNLSPADIRKEGTAYDMPVAVAVLASYGMIEPESIKHSVLIGELGLDGEIKAVRGILSIVSAAKEAGFDQCFLPEDNVLEGSVIQGIQVIGVSHILELTELLNNPEKLKKRRVLTKIQPVSHSMGEQVDFSDVHGQLLFKRATEIAVAGRHNILYIGMAGTGKTMIAQRIPTIMPDLTDQERLEISKVYSICGLLPRETPLLSERPFRSPHHTISQQALTGGGKYPRPGELSLASGGVLFLDEFPEFRRSTIEVLRQPLEEHQITVSRLHGSYVFPADFLLAAAMNPCQCGYFPDRSRCNCSEWQIRQYLGKISKPLLDRIDICVESAPVSYGDLKGSKKEENSESVKKRVIRAQQIQQERFDGSRYLFNSRMNGSQINRYCALSPEDDAFIKQIFETMKLSVRGYNKILKVARTIADLAGEDNISRGHLCEAIAYRSLDEKYWGGIRNG